MPFTLSTPIRNHSRCSSPRNYNICAAFEQFWL